MADWSTLPSDLLIAIALKFDSINELIYFSAVCRSWNDVFTVFKRDSATPWLLQADPSPKHDHKLDVCSRRSKIFEINKVKGLELNIPQANRRQCFGSEYGWIVMIGFDDNQVSLFNPITKAQLTLPCLASLPVLRNSSMRYEIMERGKLDIWEPIEFRILKAIVLKIDDNDFVVMLIYHHNLESSPYTSKNNSLALSRPVNRTWRWTKVITSGEKFPYVIDVVYWNGIVLILHVNGLITCCETSAIVDFSPSSPVYAKPYHSIVFPTFKQGRVYKLDRSGNDKCWTVVEDLGDYMVFVGNNSAMSVHKSKSPNYQHDAIYFTDDIKFFWEDLKPRWQDIGMFDMKSREFKRFSENNDKIRTTFRPLWFIPKF
ncbi:F-box protein SKIP23-like [Chenopodium quinoa]|nr:F-box protein SKIP23-like [Chenopodium quinoa]